MILKIQKNEKKNQVKLHRSCMQKNNYGSLKKSSKKYNVIIYKWILDFGVLMDGNFFIL